MASEPTTPQSDHPLHLVSATPDAGTSHQPAAGLQARASTDEAADLALRAIPSAPVATRTNWLWLLLIIAGGYGIFYLGGWATSRNVRPSPAGPFAMSATPAPTPAVVVHVAGAVSHPGVYRLPFNSRITDAIHEAGGPLPNADTNALNLAAWVEDGTKIEVPTKSAPTAAAPSAIPTQGAAPVIAERSVPPSAVPPVSSAKVARPKPKATRPAKPKADSGLPHAITPSGKTSKKIDPAYLAQHPVNVNTAPAADLQGLPGIGPAMAAKIIAYRQENGHFQTVDDLRNVKGIGEKKLEKLQPLVTVK